MSEDNKRKADLDIISTICFICNSFTILLLIGISIIVMRIWIKDWGFVLFLSVLLFFPFALLEERCISKHINTCVERIYNRFVSEKEK